MTANRGPWRDDPAARAAAEAAFDRFREFFETGSGEALAAGRSLLADIPDETLANADLARELNALGSDLRGAFHEHGRRALLEAAIDAYRKAIELVPPGEYRPLLLSSLAIGLTDRFDLAGDATDAAGAVEAAEEALSEAAPNSPWRAALVENLVGALLARHESTADPGDLERAAELETELAARETAGPFAEDALARRASDARRRHRLGRAFAGQYERSGRAADLDEAIAHLRDAAEVEPYYAADLSPLLTERFGRTGHLDDLDAAIETASSALARLGARDAPLPAVVAALESNLSIALRQRHALDSDFDAISRVAGTAEEALASLPPADPARYRYLVNLANILADRHHELGDPADLDRSIRLYVQARRAAPRGDERERIGVNLAAVLVDRFRRSGTRRDVDRAIRLLDRALARLPAGSPFRSGALVNLGAALEAACGNDGRAGDLERGVAAFREAATMADASGAAAITAARDWGLWATNRESWAEAAAAYRLAIGAVLRAVGGEAARRNKEAWLAAAQGVPAAAAYALAEIGATDEAVVALEQSRTVLLSEALGHRSGGGPARPGDELEVVAAAAQAAPLVYLLAAPRGGTALVARAAPELTVERVALPAFDHGSLAGELSAYVAAYADRDEHRDPWLDVLDRIGAWLWTAAIGPLLAALGGVERAVLIPVGPVGLLPLQAAWRAADQAGGSGREYVGDVLALSYAPSARALFHAQRSDPEGAGVAGVLGVDDPQPVSAPVLRYATPEVDHVLAGAAVKLRLRKQRARSAEVLDALDRYAVVHLACHAEANVAAPLASALLLAGNARLTLADLLAKPLHARLVVLSACETAMIGFRNTDETVGFPAGFLQAGARGVVASQWAVNDLSTLLLMSRFSDLRRDGGLHPSDALNRAQRWVRDASNREKWERFPEFEALSPPPGRSAAASRFWASARVHTHPYHWAGFVYTGA